jgi:beta-mannosidase
MLELPATVPGCVHLDLLAAGVIADPYLDRNEENQHWIAGSVWEYRLEFDHRPGDGERVDLVFDGLDTVAAVSLNGRQVGAAANMHRTYRFDVSSVIAAGANEVTVLFDSPLAHATAEQARLGDLPRAFEPPYNFIRKMACNFGWDWGPRLTTSGIWRPVWLEIWSGARMAAVRPTATVTPAGDGVVDIAADIQWDGPPREVVMRASLDGRTVEVVASSAHAKVRLKVPSVELWWPVGRGSQRLYSLVVETLVDGTPTDRVERRIGFRTVELDTSAETDGSRFALVVNGERVWVRGFNWIPDDCFPARVDRGRYERRITEAVDANANLLRVWGGGIYESDDFYHVCDQRGVLVWQDFLFACAAYPGELAAEVEPEAMDAINRLMAHPSLVIWNGNNENLWGWWDWGWQPAVGEREWGPLFYRQILPSLVTRLDPARPYIDGSPTSGTVDIHPNDPNHGPIHIWDVWNERDYTHYRSYRPRFVAEFGFQAPANYATLARAVSARPLSPADATLAHHQKAEYGMALLDRALRAHAGEPDGFDRWLYLTQLIQSDALRTGVGHFRSLHERCSGVVWWQLNDCWPALSWSVVDGDGRRKLAWYAARTAFASRSLVITPQGGEGGPVCVAINDTRQPWVGTIIAVRVGLDGAVRADTELGVEVPPDSAQHIDLPAELTSPGETAREVLVATLDDARACWLWEEIGGIEWGRTEPDIDITTRAYKTVEITVGTAGLVVDLCLLADMIDPAAAADSQLITLLPGERHTFVVSTDDPDRFDHDAVRGALFSASAARF